MTLDGINSSYFKSKDNPAPPPPVTGPMDLSAKSKTSTAPNAVQQHSGGGGNNGGAIIKPANVITNKPTASIAPMPKEIRPSLPKLSKQQNNQLEKQQKQIKTAAVAPKEDDKPKIRVRKKITGPKIDHEKQQQSSVETSSNTIRMGTMKMAPPATTSKITTSMADNKKVRAKITGPDPDPQPIPVVTTKEVCKFWPQCKRGDSCIYLHPKSPRPVLSVNSPLPPLAKDKFKWTSSSSK